jgi:1-acyl-sn-glycerol-3-phosphate acyltransferase
MIRFHLRAAAIALSLLLFVPLHYLWRLFRLRSPWPRRFLQWVGFAAGARVRLVGTPLRSHVLIVANHVSWLDIMVLAGASGAAFVAKAEVGRWPLVGWLAGLNDTVYVERAARGAVRGQADSLRDALASGRPVALFPEGTTEGAGEVLPFRASLLASLFPPLPALRVQPVAIDYGAATGDISWTGDESAGANAKRVMARRGTIPVTLTFLPPLEPAAFTDRKALAASARNEVAHALGASEAAAAPL